MHIAFALLALLGITVTQRLCTTSTSTRKTPSVCVPLTLHRDKSTNAHGHPVCIGGMSSSPHVVCRAQAALAAQLRGTFGFDVAEGGSGRSEFLPLGRRFLLVHPHHMTKTATTNSNLQASLQASQLLDVSIYILKHAKYSGSPTNS